MCHLLYALLWEQQVFSLECIINFLEIHLHKNGIYTDGRLAGISYYALGDDSTK